MGLPKDAREFLADHLPRGPHPAYGPEQDQAATVCGTYFGMFGNKYPLYRYELDCGEAEEFLQAAPWSSGPCFFIGLRANGLTFTWTEEEIERCL